MGVVVAAHKLRSVSGFVHRRAAKFTAPDDKGVFEHPAPLQVCDQRCRCLIGLLHSFGKP